MVLNELGIIANAEWLKTREIRPDMNLELDNFIVMPDHFHGIIMIGDNKFNSGNTMNDNNDRDARHGVSTGITGISKTGETDKIITIKNKFGPQSKNLGSIVRGFKSSVTTYARKNNIEFGWQERFHDHIIRSHDEFMRISDYIVNNPVKWMDDKFHDEKCA